MFPFFHFHKQSFIFELFLQISALNWLKDDKLVISVLADLIIMNLEKNDSVSLCEESNSERLCLSFFI